MFLTTPHRRARGLSIAIGLALPLVPLILGACGDWKVDSSALTARTATPAEGPSCSSCHGYPLNDTNHVYHLIDLGKSKSVNGKISCLDCHSTAIRSQAVTLFDTVYEAPDGEQWRTLDHPNAGDLTSDGDVIRSLPLFGLDTLHENHPFPMPDRPGAKPKFQEYMTGLAHMNGNVDVVFDNRVSTPDKFAGKSAEYNPTAETCSAIACHPAGEKPYRWAAPSKGLKELNEDHQ
jgi:hypothetical protein